MTALGDRYYGSPTLLMFEVQKTQQFPLPEGIPVPSLKIGDRVTWSDYNEKERVGTIVGLTWVDDSTALMQRRSPGWEYTVSQIFSVNDVAQIIEIPADYYYINEANAQSIEKEEN